eukprot:Awhi_evm1s2653
MFTYLNCNLLFDRYIRNVTTQGEFKRQPSFNFSIPSQLYLEDSQQSPDEEKKEQESEYD